jgi:hypothetical protein
MYVFYENDMCVCVCVDTQSVLSSLVLPDIMHWNLACSRCHPAPLIRKLWSLQHRKPKFMIREHLCLNHYIYFENKTVAIKSHIWYT